MIHAKDMLSQDGEQAVITYLEGCGFRIIDRNWQCDDGKLHVVAVERDTLVVCDVRARRVTQHGLRLEEISKAKCQRLRRMAVIWLNAHGMRFDQIRIDVVGLLYEGTSGFTIEHVRAVG